MYTLTLTKSERNAFDWVGNRYMTGNEVADLLCECLPPDKDWDTEIDVEFSIPESIAWKIKDCYEEEDCCWPCFSEELTRKMNSLIERIV